MQAQKPSGGLLQRSQQGVHILVFIARMFASPLEVFLRRDFGSKYFGFPAFFSLALLPLWMVFWPGKSSTGLNLLGLLLMFLFIAARRRSMKLVKEGAAIHTRSNGYSRLAAILKHTPEEKIKSKWEPAVCFLAGIVLMLVDEPVGSFVLVATVGLVLVQSTIESVERARVMELNDAMIEQQFIAERFREMQRNQSRR